MEAMTTLPDFQVPKIAGEDADENKGTFTIEPLDKGFGYTFGNSLRRVLLSSLGGAAITSVRIEGVDKSEDKPIGVVPIDSIFSPIRRAAYSVDSARVGQRTDFDKLTLEVETDGSIEPGAALREAAEILIKSLAIFTTADRVDELRGEGAIAATDGGGGGGEAAAVPGADGLDEILIEELELGVRSYNCLKRAGIQTVGELVRKSESEPNAIPNFGRKSIEEVQETLRARGLSLRAD